MLLDNPFTGDMRVENEVISLMQEGHHVTVLCITKGEHPEREDYYGAKIVRFQTNAALHKKRRGWTGNKPDFFLRWWSAKANAYLQQHPADALHAHDLYMVPVALTIKRKTLPNAIIVSDLHENYPAALENYSFTHKFPGKFFVSIKRWRKREVSLLAQCDRVITVIEEASKRYAKLGVPASKLFVVPNYVNADQFLDADKQLEYTVMYDGCYIGGFDLHRGIEPVIRGMVRIVKEFPEVKLLLVGAGPNESSLKALTEELQLTKNIHFAGWQPPRKLPSLIRQSRVCLVPHKKTEHTDHTIPHKLFQYMLMQKPVLVSNCAPLKRIVEDEKCGLVFESENEKDFSETFKTLLRSEDKIAMGKRGLAAVQKRYNWEQAASGLLDVYD